MQDDFDAIVDHPRRSRGRSGRCGWAESDRQGEGVSGVVGCVMCACIGFNKGISLGSEGWCCVYDSIGLLIVSKSFRIVGWSLSPHSRYRVLTHLPPRSYLLPLLSLICSLSTLCSFLSEGLEFQFEQLCVAPSVHGGWWSWGH